MKEIYNLYLDTNEVDSCNSAMDGVFGLVRDHGHIGSEEWYFALASSQLSVLLEIGKVFQVDDSAMNDWPMCSIKLIDGGGVGRWRRYFDQSELDEFGEYLHVEYTRVRLKHPPVPNLKDSKIVLRMWLAQEPTLNINC